MSKETRRTVRKEWLERAGIPNRYGIALNVTISDTGYKSTEYQVRGVVDVPSRPQNDDERLALAKVLLSRADIPERSQRRFRLVDWERTDGGEGVIVHQCGKIPTITANDIIPGSFRRFEAPAFEEPRREELPGDLEHTKWRSEYQANQYSRYESRRELHQRLQDIWVNKEVLSPSGKLTLTTEQRWYRLEQHVVDEMLVRGQPPSEQNLHPRVDIAMPHMDKHLCRKAAEVVAAQGTGNDVFVKYGALDHMKELYENGAVWISSASDLDKLTHNQAVRDDERSFVLKGGIRPVMNSVAPRTTCRNFYTKQEAPHDFAQLVARGDIQFVRIFNAPRLESNQYVELQVGSRTDYWMCCLSELLDPRLFSDFKANACVIIKKRPFFEKLVRMMQFVKPGYQPGFGRVTYDDPLGVFATNRPAYVPSSHVPMTKLFRYAYQKESRFVWMPAVPQKKLISFRLPIGSLSGFAELLEFNA